MIINKEMIEAITRRVVHVYPSGVEIPLAKKYENFFFYLQKYLVD